MGVRRTAEESMAYVQGYRDCFEKYNECLRECEHIHQAYNRINEIVTALCEATERCNKESPVQYGEARKGR